MDRMECKCINAIEKDFLSEILQDFIMEKTGLRNKSVDNYKRMAAGDRSIDTQRYIDMTLEFYDHVINKAQGLKDEIDKMPQCI